MRQAQGFPEIRRWPIGLWLDTMDRLTKAQRVIPITRSLADTAQIIALDDYVASAPIKTNEFLS